MDFSKLLGRFVKIDIWIYLIFYMDLSKLKSFFYAFFMYFSTFPKQNPTEV